jgi:CRISPR system Cascade subunit CasD
MLGLICAALGAGGEQRELLAAFAPLEQRVIAYSRKQKNGKAIQALQLQDFHMVGSGYDDKDPWQTLHIPKTSNQKAAVGGGTKLTYRHYLQEAVFAVAMAVPSGMQNGIEDALITPCWDISLGRKCCVPTEFVYQGMHESMAAAVRHAEEKAEKKQLAELFRVLDGDHGDDHFILPDVPIQFGPDKLYSERLVTLIAT